MAPGSAGGRRSGTCRPCRRCTCPGGARGRSGSCSAELDAHALQEALVAVGVDGDDLVVVEVEHRDHGGLAVQPGGGVLADQPAGLPVVGGEGDVGGVRGCQRGVQRGHVQTGVLGLPERRVDRVAVAGDQDALVAARDRGVDLVDLVLGVPVRQCRRRPRGGRCSCRPAPGPPSSSTTKYGLVCVFRISETPVRSSLDAQAASRPESSSTAATHRATRRPEPALTELPASRTAGPVTMCRAPPPCRVMCQCDANHIAGPGRQVGVPEGVLTARSWPATCRSPRPAAGRLPLAIRRLVAAESSRGGP